MTRSLPLRRDEVADSIALYSGVGAEQSSFSLSVPMTAVKYRSSEGFMNLASVG